MVRRSTWVVLGIFAAVLALTWFLQNRAGQELAQTTPTAAPEMVFDAQSANPVSIRITSADGKVVTIEDKGVDGWQVIEPVLSPADIAQITQLTSSLINLRALQVLDIPPALEVMDLTEPAYQIAVQWSDGRSEIVELGKVTPTNSGYYARINAGKIVLIPVSGIQNILGLLDTPPVALATETPELVESLTPEPEAATPVANP